MESVSEPSIGWVAQACSRGLIFAAAAASTSAVSKVADAVRRSRKYWSKNLSPSVRPFSTAAACSRVRSSSVLFCVTCDCRLAIWRSRSSADPPGGNRTMPAPTRLAASRTPRIPRTTNLGSLKFLAIVHTHMTLVQGLVLRGRGARMQVRRPELGCLRYALQEVDERQRIGRAHRHIQSHDIARIDLRKTNLNQLHVVRQHGFEVGENPRPTDGFAIDQCVEQYAALQHFGVGGLP